MSKNPVDPIWEAGYEAGRADLSEARALLDAFSVYPAEYAWNEWHRKVLALLARAGAKEGK